MQQHIQTRAASVLFLSGEYSPMWCSRDCSPRLPKAHQKVQWIYACILLVAAFQCMQCACSIGRHSLKPLWKISWCVRHIWRGDVVRTLSGLLTRRMLQEGLQVQYVATSTFWSTPLSHDHSRPCSETRLDQVRTQARHAVGWSSDTVA